MPEIADKSFVKKVCVDDFAFRKRYTYGTVMVDLDSHRIIDIIDSRETKQVENWLLAYLNLEVISRDGAQAYASAASRSHPEALQVSDRFHLLKNLSDSIEKYLYRLLPSRLSIPTGKQSPECQALYDTRNRGERIRFAQKKRSQGTTVNDIALLLHSSTSTILKYLAIPKDQIPESRENARERQYIRSMKNKQGKMEEVRTLYVQGHAFDEITRLTGHTSLTVKNYLKEDYPVTNGHYDQRRPGKLAPYEKVVIQMRSQGITYREIHECICRQGYTGTITSLRVFMQKERTHQKSISENRSAAVEYIPRKCLCQLLYHKLEDVKGMTQDQYEEALKKYSIFGQVYSLLKEFHRNVFSKHDEELDTWINSAEKLQIEELNSYINGLKNDISAVKNSIKYPYNNGLAEGSVNKIKLIKRVIYGRNSFLLLKAKLLLNEFYYQIN